MDVHPLPAAATSHIRGRHYRYYDLVMAGFVTVLICSNLIGPAKVARIPLPEGVTLPFFGNAIDFGAGNIFFPIGYIFGDILTEVYGYARARKVIWAGFLGLAFAAFMSFVIIRLPASPDEPFNAVYQPAIETALGGTWRIVAASLLAYWCGDFVNSFVLAKLKIQTAGRFLWMRTIGSTIFGQGVDSLLFYPLAFYGIWNNDLLARTMVFNWCFKLFVEIAFTPLTYVIVNALKRAEREDFYDTDTNFTPFSLQD
jgi:hypothetical protein